MKNRSRHQELASRNVHIIAIVIDVRTNAIHFKVKIKDRD